MTGKIIKGIAGFYYVYVEETKEAKENATYQSDRTYQSWNA